jgi:putative ABC transport system substrate-binding protein
MRRREFITLLGGTLAWPLAARAQQPVPVIGVLSAVSPGPFARRVAAFHSGLSETGYVEGRNLTIEYRWAEEQYDRLPALAAEILGRHVVLMVTYADAAALVSSYSMQCLQPRGKADHWASTSNAKVAPGADAAVA